MYIVSEIIDILCTDESTITHMKEFFFFFRYCRSTKFVLVNIFLLLTAETVFNVMQERHYVSIPIG